MKQYAGRALGEEQTSFRPLRRAVVATSMIYKEELDALHTSIWTDELDMEKQINKKKTMV